jgi:NodT family efflux transporter outer membrane factor (OMF) lipoprotein
MNRLTTLLFLAALLATTSSGCMLLGPDYRTPSASLQEEWLEAGDPLLDTTVPVAPEWWQGAFHDPVLDQLVAEALSQSLTLRSAGLRVLQARQQLMIAIGNQYPQQQQLSGQGGVDGFMANSRRDDFYDWGFNLTWEADIWGRFRRQIESASAALDAGVADYDGVMVSLIADVARTYLLIRTTQQRLVVVQQNLELQQESVRITTAKFEAGEVSALDVDQAQTLLHTTTASVAAQELTLQQLKNSLAILLGRPPRDMKALLWGDQQIPAVKSEIAVGMPQDLIRRRPDIRLAERQLAAQSAQIGFAVTELYPHLGLGGTIGSSVPSERGQNFSDLFKRENIGYSAFGFFEWNIFNYGRLKNNVRLQDAIFQQLLEDYRQSVLQAQGEVENAIIAFLKSRQQLEAFKLAEAASRRAAEISKEQYQDGLVDFNTVISTLRTLVAQQEQLVATQGTVATNLVDVYRSLGGGWEIRQDKTPLELIPGDTRNEMLERTGYWDRTFKKSTQSSHERIPNSKIQKLNQNPPPFSP